MSTMSKLMTLYPTIVIIMIIGSLINAVYSPSLLSFLLIPTSLYLFPLITFRFMNFFFPIIQGKSNLSEREYSPWWGGHQMQLIYYAVPQLEALLRIIPGAFSLWLRLWGSKIGKNVYWTPNVEIDDRSLVEIGDNAVFGHKVEIVSHVVGPRNGVISLYSKAVVIGKNCFIGAGSRFAPGSKVEDNAFVPVLTDVYINQVITKDHDLKYKGPRGDYEKKTTSTVQGD